MAGEPGWVTPEADTRRANAARVYDYRLGGSRNFLAHQDAAGALTALEPCVRAMAQANRAFLGRAVRLLAAAGIGQFLDIGSGIPTDVNVHEVAQRAVPGAQVVYVDIDTVAVGHSKHLLVGNAGAAVIDADLRDPEKILAHQAVGRLIDFGERARPLLAPSTHELREQTRNYFGRDRMPPDAR